LWIAAWLWLGVAASLAAEQLVWHIGKFDDASGEFRSQGIKYADPQSDLHYGVGQSKNAEACSDSGPSLPMTWLAARLPRCTSIASTSWTPKRGTVALEESTPKLLVSASGFE
jgi:hypothetical protein